MLIWTAERGSGVPFRRVEKFVSQVSDEFTDGTPGGGATCPTKGEAKNHICFVVENGNASGSGGSVIMDPPVCFSKVKLGAQDALIWEVQSEGYRVIDHAIQTISKNEFRVLRLVRAFTDSEPESTQKDWSCVSLCLGIRRPVAEVVICSAMPKGQIIALGMRGMVASGRTQQNPDANSLKRLFAMMEGKSLAF